VSQAYDLIAVGETMASLIATDGPLETATTFHATHGGAETNAAVGMARLGATTAWIGRLGDDAFGRGIRRALSAEGIELRWVVLDPVRPTGVMIRDTEGGVAYRRTGSAASAMTPDDLRGAPVEQARAVLVTGVTALLGDGPQRTAVALLERSGGFRVVDPNLRPGLVGSENAVELILPLVRRCDLLVGGEHELATIAAVTASPEAGLRTLAERCQALGPREVVVKRGAAGAAVLDEHGVWSEHAGPSVREIDPVGAGDAFNGGYVHARLAGVAAADALIVGARAGAAVASSLGDTPATIETIRADPAGDGS
jgi:2-dehydro-3-deoxygluconokinase